MLQNPSKYHSNPLSHFLALHNSQVAAHAPAHALAPPSAAIAIHQQHQQHQHQHNHHHHQSSHHHHHAHLNVQQLPFSQQQHDQHTAAAAAAAAIIGSHHHHHHHHNQQLIEAANTTLDVGKSFTIAAILGLQKSAIENASNRKDYNNAINLSINGGNSNESQRDLTDTFTDDDDSDKDPQRSFVKNAINNNNNNNNDNNATTTIKCNSGSSSSSFNCDNIVNRFGPPLSSTQFGATHQQTLTAVQQQQQQAVANGFVSGNSGGATTGITSRTPTALQSLQQLHQQHAQQTTMVFHREKLKTDNSAKKTSLKNKRVRTIFTPEQLERLEAEFERQQYMVGPERLYLAHTLQLTEAQVKVWFQNRRIKWRKHHLEITQQRLALLRQSQLPATPSSVNGNSATNTNNGALVSNTGTRLQISSGSSIPSCDGDDDDEYNKQHDEDIHQLSRIDASDSDLSICNDSMDAESVMDGGEEA